MTCAQFERSPCSPIMHLMIHLLNQRDHSVSIGEFRRYALSHQSFNQFFFLFLAARASHVRGNLIV